MSARIATSREGVEPMVSAASHGQAARMLSTAATVARVALGLLAVATSASLAGAEDPPGVLPPPSMDEARAWAERIDDGLRAGDASVLAGKLHVPSVVSLALAGLEDLPRGFESGFRDGMHAADPLTPGIAKALEQDAWIALLRVRTTAAGRPSALFRIVTADGGVSYVEYVLGRHPDGRVAIVDWIILAMGQPMSDLYRANGLDMLREQADRSLIDRLTGRDNELVAALPVRARMIDQLEAGDGRGALATWATLPESSKAQRMIAVLRIGAARLIADDGAAYLEAVRDYGRRFPEGASRSLHAIHAFVLTERWADALGAIDEVEAAVGGDPYLDSIRADVLLSAGRRTEAKAALERLSRDAPDVDRGPWGLVSMAVDDGDFAAIGPLLDDLETRFGHDVEAVVAEDGFAPYRASAAHAAWRKARADRLARGTAATTATPRP